MDQTYQTNRKFRIVCNVLAGIFFITVLLIPFAVFMWWLAYKSKVTVHADHLEVNWLGNRVMKWDDFEGIRWGGIADSGGIVAKLLLKPLICKVRDKKGRPRIAIGCYENGDEIVRTICERTGLQIAA